MTAPVAYQPPPLTHEQLGELAMELSRELTSYTGEKLQMELNSMVGAPIDAFFKEYVRQNIGNLESADPQVAFRMAYVMGYFFARKAEAHARARTRETDFALT